MRVGSIWCMDPTNTSQSPRTPTNDELPALLSELEKSGASVSEFARSRNLTTWKLYQGRRSARNDKPGQMAFDPIQVVGTGNHGARLEIALNSGHVIHVPIGFDSSTLRGVIECLVSC